MSKHFSTGMFLESSLLFLAHFWNFLAILAGNLGILQLH